MRAEAWRTPSGVGDWRRSTASAAAPRPSLRPPLSSAPPSPPPFLCSLDPSSVHLFVSRPLCAEQSGDFPSLRVSGGFGRVAAPDRQRDRGTKGRRRDEAGQRAEAVLSRADATQLNRSSSQPAHTQSAFEIPPRAPPTGRGHHAPQLTDRGGLDRSAKGSEAAGAAAAGGLIEQVAATSSAEAILGGDLATR